GYFDADKGMAGLVISRVALFFIGHDDRAPLRTHQHLVLGPLKVNHRDDLAILPGSRKRGLIDQVGQVGAGKPGSRASDDIDVDVISKRNLARMNRQNPFAALDVRTLDDDAPIEPPGAEQRRIQYVWPVG